VSDGSENKRPDEASKAAQKVASGTHEYSSGRRQPDAATAWPL